VISFHYDLQQQRLRKYKHKVSKNLSLISILFWYIMFIQRVHSPIRSLNSEEQAIYLRDMERLQLIFFLCVGCLSVYNFIKDLENGSRLNQFERNADALSGKHKSIYFSRLQRSRYRVSNQSIYIFTTLLQR